METSHYVVNVEDQKRLLRRLTPLSTADGGWSERLVDQETGEVWVSSYPRSEEHGGGPRVLRREAAAMDALNDRLGACLMSGRLDDAVGLGLDLSNDPESWADVVAHLEHGGAAYPRGSVRAFLNALGVARYTGNRRPVLGKSPDEVRRDAAHFEDLSARTLRLLDAR